VKAWLSDFAYWYVVSTAQILRAVLWTLLIAALAVIAIH